MTDHPPCTACGGPVERRPKEPPGAYRRRKTCGCRAAGVRNEAPTEKNRWLSRYGGGYVADGQWLAEVMSARRAAREKRTLPLRFWETSDGEREFFLAQVRYAAKLLARFPVEAVLAALEAPEGKAAFSLAAPWLAGLAEKATASLAKDADAPADAPAEAVPLPRVPVARYVPPPVLSPPSALSRLRR